MTISYSLGDLAAQAGCALVGDPDVLVTRVATLEAAEADCLSFLANPRYARFLSATRAGAVVLEEAHVDDCPVNALVSANPYATYAHLAALLHPVQPEPPGVHPRAWVDATAHVDESASIGPMAVVERGASIGPRCTIGPGSVVGAGASLGPDCRLHANVTLCHHVRLGARVSIKSGAVIGADGFGFARDDGNWVKVPQVGSVDVGDDVEIGASTTIDRGALQDTVIEEGVRLDNQIQVGHNVRIGAHTIVAACSGIAGSTTIGKRCMIAGAAGFVGHLTIADDVVITGQTMVNRSISEAGVYSSALPMDDAVRWRKNSARFRRLDDLARSVKALEKNARRDDDKS